jgi:hypothetical protein
MGTSSFRKSSFHLVQNSHHLMTCFYRLWGQGFHQNYLPAIGYRGVPLCPFSSSHHFPVGMDTSFFKVSSFDIVQNSHHLATCFHRLPGLDFYQNYSPATGHRGVPFRSFSPSRHFLVFSTQFSTVHESRWQRRNQRLSNTKELSKFSEELNKFIEG